MTLIGESIATASAAEGAAAGCAAQFEEAQRIDMESFRDYDAETFRAGHHPGAVTVFASGAVRKGINAIMTALGPHFANREALWASLEIYRVVDGASPPSSSTTPPTTSRRSATTNAPSPA